MPSEADPVAKRWLDLGGARVRYLAAGEGPPLVLLHGNPNTAAAWADLIARVEHRYQCLAPDLPGFGKSGVPQAFDCSLESMARFVEHFLEAAGIVAPVRVVVHDFGGFFGLAYAVRHPDRVAAIAILNTAFFADRRWHFFARILRTPGLGELAMALMSRRGFRWHMRRSAPGLNDAQIDAVYAGITPAAKRMALSIYRAMDPKVFHGWEDGLRELTARVPTVVLWGERDPYLPPAFAGRFGAQEVHRLPGCGHWPHLEAVDEVGPHLLTFLAATEGDPDQLSARSRD